MCGIFGYVSRRPPGPDEAILRRATNLLRHRGPDGGGYWYAPPVFLGHRRLAIIDLRSGEQPMTSPDGRYVITYNGEVYNYVELRDELKAKRHVFTTTSDTEVVLAAYREWGPDMASRLVGMFALAIYDRQARTLYFARDRFGEKPLLVAASSDAVIFASEMAPIAAVLPGTRAVDEEALADYLCLNYVAGSRTLMRGVRRVLPGQWQLYGPAGHVQTTTYWLPPGAADRSADTRAEPELLDDLQERIDRAMAITLRSDVPVALFLSGGIDSSIVAESATRLGRLACAFTVDMHEAGFSEWPAARAVADRLGLEIVRVPFSADALDRLPSLVAHADDPLADSSALAVWCIAEQAGRRVKVVLGGDGGDELFAGYLTYRASLAHARVVRYAPAPVRRLLARLSTLLPANDRRKVSASYRAKRFLRALDLPTGEAHFTWNGTWLPREAAELAATRGTIAALDGTLARLAERSGLSGHPGLGALQCADLQEYLPSDILTKVDRMTMAHGLESRAPLLNPDVADLALRLPPRMRIDPRRGTKVALRRLCERHFGAEQARAPKQGFSVPIHAWLRRQDGALVREVLEPGRVDATGVLNGARVRTAVDAHLSGREALGWELWGLMVLVLWHETRIASPPPLDRLAGADDLRSVRPAALS